MWLMLQQDKPEDFVIATSESHSIREFVQAAFKHVGVDIMWVRHYSFKHVKLCSDIKLLPLPPPHFPLPTSLPPPTPSPESILAFDSTRTLYPKQPDSFDFRFAQETFTPSTHQIWPGHPWCNKTKISKYNSSRFLMVSLKITLLTNKLFFHRKKFFLILNQCKNNFQRIKFFATWVILDMTVTLIKINKDTGSLSLNWRLRLSSSILVVLKSEAKNCASNRHTVCIFPWKVIFIEINAVLMQISGWFLIEHLPTI